MTNAIKDHNGIFNSTFTWFQIEFKFYNYVISNAKVKEHQEKLPLTLIIGELAGQCHP